MEAEARHGVHRPLGDDVHHGLCLHRPGLAVLGGHVLYAHACGKDMIGAVLVGHHRIVHHGCVRLEVSESHVALTYHWHRDKEGCQRQQYRFRFHWIVFLSKEGKGAGFAKSAP